MSLAELIELVKCVFQFPSVILQFIKILQKTPQENHEALLKKITQEQEDFNKTGRPNWD